MATLPVMHTKRFPGEQSFEKLCGIYGKPAESKPVFFAALF